MLGRTRETNDLQALLEGARDGRSAAVVVHGEAGIGKSTLLADAIAAAEDFRVVRARGYESESDIPFAGLLDLLTPLLDLLDRIPEAQARALRGAMAIEEPSPHDKFAVPAAVLSMLGAAAEEQPVLAIVDDAHWLDDATREALLFTAQRIEAEGIVLLIGLRDGEGLHVAHRRIDLLEQRQAERRGLARAGLRLADDVAALEHRRDRLLLDGAGLLVPDVAQGLERGLGEAEVLEGGHEHTA